MRVLDLDLDFFLTGLCPLAGYDMRPPDETASPWPEEDVRAFLENRCGLSRRRPLPGRSFETHDEALDFWKHLPKPLSVTHVDAHADLAIGRPGPDYVLQVVLSTHPNVRPFPEKYRRLRKLDEANYLLFALAFRWIDELTLVRAPFSMRDVPEIILHGGCLRLRSPVSALFEPVHGKESPVPLTVVDDYRRWKAPAFDAVSVAHSPRYAPRSADPLLRVIEEYIALPGK